MKMRDSTIFKVNFNVDGIDPTTNTQKCHTKPNSEVLHKRFSGDYYIYLTMKIWVWPLHADQN